MLGSNQLHVPLLRNIISEQSDLLLVAFNDDTITTKQAWAGCRIVSSCVGLIWARPQLYNSDASDWFPCHVPKLQYLLFTCQLWCLSTECSLSIIKDTQVSILKCIFSVTYNSCIFAQESWEKIPKFISYYFDRAIKIVAPLSHFQ